jgi:hypothetical protein
LLLHSDDELVSTLTAVTVAGKEWEKAAIGSDDQEFDDLADRHATALGAFELSARRTVSGRQTSAPSMVFVRARQTGRFGRETLPGSSEGPATELAEGTP